MHSPFCDEEAARYAALAASHSPLRSPAQSPAFGAQSLRSITRQTSNRVPKEARDDLEDIIRQHLERSLSPRHSPKHVDKVILSIADELGVEVTAVRLIWLGVARTVRAPGGSTSTYPRLAQRLHRVCTEVVDLGQFSATRSNSCLFLVAAAALADRRLSDHRDAYLPGALGVAIDAAFAGSSWKDCRKLCEEHRKDSNGVLGHTADRLRDATCDLLAFDRDFYFPFFSPVGSSSEPSDEDYDRWVERLRGAEQGDELVVLSLARLCGMAVQPVQLSGYRVPIIDPTDAADVGWVTYWGNDDIHWVWLRHVDR